jgi:hypothetical protein
MLNEVKHLAIIWEILRSFDLAQDRCAQNDIVHHLTCDKTLTCFKILFIQRIIHKKIPNRFQRYHLTNAPQVFSHRPFPQRKFLRIYRLRRVRQ